MHTVTIYTTPSCVYCKMAKEYFTEHQVAYTEKNVLIDLSAREEMVKKSGQLGVPVIDIDGQLIVGFDKPAIEKLLAA
ncbi:MAG: glutaredoxin domain-containing protein [bacterium]|nr:glutaredoxin domain-containing protein [bacterium]